MNIILKRGETKIGKTPYHVLKLDPETDAPIIDTDLTGDAQAAPVGPNKALGFGNGALVQIMLEGRYCYRTLREQEVT